MPKKVFQSTKPGLMEAYALLFSGARFSSVKQLHRLDPSDLKSAFRDIAKKTHPDRARHLGVSEQELSERFKQIHWAYKALHDFIVKGETKIIPPRTRPRRQAPAQQAQQAEGARSANAGTATDPGSDRAENRMPGKRDIPLTELPLGQYLLFNGIISLQSLIKAILWQRQQRPAFGAIAREWNLMTRNDIAAIFKNRRPNEKVGECALRLGYLNSFQRHAILCKQTRAQRPLGQYFIEERIISAADMERLLVDHRKHNSRARLWALRKKARTP
jgi:hypothetical protein